MRVTSDLFVSALMRRVQADGGFATLLNKGAGDGGAVFVAALLRDGRSVLFTPAMQASYEGFGDQRLFERQPEPLDALHLNERIASERKFDPDIWVVEIETDAPETYLDIAEN